MFIKRMVDGDGYASWVLHEQGQLAHPLRVMSEFDLDALLDQVHEQRKNLGTRPALQVDGTVNELRRLAADGDQAASDRGACAAAADLLDAGARGTKLYTTKEKR